MMGVSAPLMDLVVTRVRYFFVAKPNIANISEKYNAMETPLEDGIEPLNVGKIELSLPCGVDISIAKEEENENNQLSAEAFHNVRVDKDTEGNSVFTTVKNFIFSQSNNDERCRWNDSFRNSNQSKNISVCEMIRNSIRARPRDQADLYSCSINNGFNQSTVSHHEAEIIYYIYTQQQKRDTTIIGGIKSNSIRSTRSPSVTISEGTEIPHENTQANNVHECVEIPHENTQANNVHECVEIPRDNTETCNEHTVEVHRTAVIHRISTEPLYQPDIPSISEECEIASISEEVSSNLSFKEDSERERSKSLLSEDHTSSSLSFKEDSDDDVTEPPRRLLSLSQLYVQSTNDSNSDNGSCKEEEETEEANDTIKEAEALYLDVTDTIISNGHLDVTDTIISNGHIEADVLTTVVSPLEKGKKKKKKNKRYCFSFLCLRGARGDVYVKGRGDDAPVYMVANGSVIEHDVSNEDVANGDTTIYVKYVSNEDAVNGDTTISVKDVSNEVVVNENIISHL